MDTGEIRQPDHWNPTNSEGLECIRRQLRRYRAVYVGSTRVAWCMDNAKSSLAEVSLR